MCQTDTDGLIAISLEPGAQVGARPVKRDYARQT